MPRVPVLNRPQVQTRPLSGVDAPLSAFTGPAPALAQAAQGLGQVAQLVEREAIRADEMRVEQAEAQYRARVDGLMVDPKTGILNQRGTNAIEGLDPFRDQLTSTASDITATLSTTRQKELFAARAERIRRDADVRAADFVGNEIQRGYDAAHTANLQRDRDDIARLAAAGDMAGVDATVRQMDERIALYGDNTGKRKEVIAQDRAEAVSVGRLTQIAAVVDVDPERAEQLLAKHGDQMRFANREQARTWIEEGTMALRSQRERDRIVSAYPDDERAALATARELEGELEDRVVARITAHFAEQRRLESEADRTFAVDIAARVETEGSVDGLSAAEVTRAKRIPNLWRSLEIRAKQVASGENPVTDWTWYEKYVNLTDNELRAANPAEYRPHLSDTDYKAFLDRQAMVRGTGGRGQRDRGFTPTELFSETLRLSRVYGLLGTDVRTAGDLNKNDRDKARFTRVHDRIREDLEIATTTKGAPLTEAETRTLMQTVFYDEVLRTKGFNRVVPRASLAPDAPFRELTPTERAGRAALRARAERAEAAAGGAAPAVPFAERVQELKAAGVSRDEAVRILTNEGYPEMRTP